MSLKQEDGRRTPEAIFSRLVKETVDADPKLWFLENRIPQLGEVGSLLPSSFCAFNHAIVHCHTHPPFFSPLLRISSGAS